MTVRKNGKTWMADFYENGRTGRRIRKKGFATKSAAQRFESDYFAALKQTGRPLDDRLSDLVTVWYDLHGCSLKDEKARLSRTMAVVQRLGDPRVSDFDVLAWARYRQSRLKDATPSTVNHEQRYLSAVFSELIRLGAWAGNNPLAKVRQIKTDQTELSFLSLEQIRQLLDECRRSTNNHTYPVALICLATGARWDEAESLTRGAIFGGRRIFTGPITGSRARCRYPRKSKMRFSRWPCLGTVGCSCPVAQHFVAPMNAAASILLGNSLTSSGTPSPVTT